MQGVELSPASALVRPGRSVLFSTRSPTTGNLIGLLIGGRRDAREAWQVAIDAVAVELLAVHGVAMHIGPWQDLAPVDGIGWPVFARVRTGQTIAVCVRNDARELRELRCVLAFAERGQGSPGPPRTGRSQRRIRHKRETEDPE